MTLSQSIAPNSIGPTHRAHQPVHNRSNVDREVGVDSPKTVCISLVASRANELLVGRVEAQDATSRVVGLFAKACDDEAGELPFRTYAVSCGLFALR